MEIAYLIVNFGGPRSLEEVGIFLTQLLCDKDVIRTKFPQFLHNILFKRIARKRAMKVRHDYAEIGGKSPIFFDTEELAKQLSLRLGSPVYTFHRYLSATHAESLSALEHSQASQIRILPLFPQFTYATTGSIARFFSKHLSQTTQAKLRWIPSYPTHPAFVRSFQRKIQSFLAAHNLPEKDSLLLFSAHGLPQSFIDTGDPYQQECERSFQAIMQAFPDALGQLCYQSRFGPEEWLRPYTEDACKDKRGRKNTIFVPLSFTSDHIETLFEIEKLYMPLIENAYRCPALGRESYWIDALANLFREREFFYLGTDRLIYRQKIIPTLTNCT